MENRAKLKYIELKKMIDSLNESLYLVELNKDYRFEKSLKDSVIQRFEYTSEGIWKFLKSVLLEDFSKDEAFAKSVLKSSYKAGIIEELDIFLDMIERRNRLSHDYHEDFSETSFDIISKDYIEPINKLLSNFSKNYE
ncbi:MAG: HI0074 family nucleotidyltransferase substrate-binding subunit [Candidatus Gracilibacteria bacterium]|nr:HI0074 family nucleotidyltransferase substrate-binding subunit [Candidatus Gracilibacteria bacterium]MDQ7023805.1 HI0074 family nucleotidyltransferase substrate-binding subunit [Candidatus Gracilibacteria bacterium]